MPVSTKLAKQLLVWKPVINVITVHLMAKDMTYAGGQTRTHNHAHIFNVYKECVTTLVRLTIHYTDNATVEYRQVK